MNNQCIAAEFGDPFPFFMQSERLVIKLGAYLACPSKPLKALSKYFSEQPLGK